MESNKYDSAKAQSDLEMKKLYIGHVGHHNSTKEAWIPTYCMSDNITQLDLFKEASSINNGVSVAANNIPIVQAAAISIEEKEIDITGIIPSLPDPIKRIATNLQTIEEKTMCIYSSLIIMGALLTGFHGMYRGKRVYPNLYFITLAPAAAGKAVIGYSSRLCAKVHDEIIMASKEQSKLYEDAQANARKNKTISLIPKPPFKVVRIPGNITSAKLIQHLSDNDIDTPSIIIEEEIDTLSNSNNSEHGNYTDTLRKSWSGEPIALSRRADNEFIECRKPKLSVIMSGTPRQVNGILKNAEDGLASRFMFYSFDTLQQWLDVSPCPTCPNITSLYDDAEQDFYSIWKYFIAKNVEIHLKPEQWTQLNEFGSKELSNVFKNKGDEAIAIVKRHSEMVLRICIILSGYRIYKWRSSDNNYTCNDEDFKTALLLIKASMQHSISILSQLPGATSNDVVDKKKQLLWNLPNSFKRHDIIGLAKNIGIAERTLDRCLSTFCKTNVLKSIGMGEYQKVK